jgi:hypothetical protein
MCKISFKFVQNESYQIFMNICKQNFAYFTSILEKLAQSDCKKTCPTKLNWLKVKKNVKCTSYKYV